MASLEVKGMDGKAVGKVELPNIDELKVSGAVLHRAIVAEEANSRQGTQSAKTRSEVRGGGRKPYRQKKTGNARQGSIRSPHYAHGGMALAVKPRDYTKKVNRKERRAALLGALAAKIAAGDVLVLDKIAFAEPKTKLGRKLLLDNGLGAARSLLVILQAYDETAFRSLRNLQNVTVRTAPGSGAPAEGSVKTAGFSTRDLLLADKIILTRDALNAISGAPAK